MFDKVNPHASILMFVWDDFDFDIDVQERKQKLSSNEVVNIYV